MGCAHFRTWWHSLDLHPEVRTRLRGALVVYEYAAEVLGWVAAGQSVGVARVVAVRGFSGVGLGDIAVAGPTGARLGGRAGGSRGRGSPRAAGPKQGETGGDLGS